MVPLEEIEIELTAPKLQGRDKQVFSKLWYAQARFKKAQRPILTELTTTLSNIAADIKKNGNISPALNEHIVNMAKFQSEVSDNVLGSILSYLYVDCDLYDEFLEICGTILDFGDEDAQRMLGNTVIEDSIQRLMARLANRPDSSPDIADKCLKLLHKRAKLLNFDPMLPPVESNKFRQAYALAMNISLRHRLLSAQTLNTCIQETYDLSSKFLGLQENKIELMRTEGRPLIHDASITLWKIKHKKWHDVISHGALGKLEVILHFRKKFGFCNDDYDHWIAKICTDRLWSSLFEMDLYLHFRKFGAKVEIGPDVKVDTNVNVSKITSFKIDDCHVGLYSPHDIVTTLYDDLPHTWQTSRELIREIIQKCPPGLSGTKSMVMIVEDPFDFSNDTDFCDSLKKDMKDKPHLGGVYLVRASRGNYYGMFLYNSDSEVMTNEIDDTITGALTRKFE